VYNVVIYKVFIKTHGDVKSSEDRKGQSKSILSTSIKTKCCLYANGWARM
jgi:hypothetical protein